MPILRPLFELKLGVLVLLIRRIHRASRLITQAASWVTLFFSACSSAGFFLDAETRDTLWENISNSSSYNEFKSHYPDEGHSVEVSANIDADPYAEMNKLYLNTSLGPYLNTGHYIARKQFQLQGDGYPAMVKAAEDDTSIRETLGQQIEELEVISRQPRSNPGYEPYAKRLTGFPGLNPENILKADHYLRQIEEAESHTPQNRPGLLPLFYQYFFKLAESHQLKPVTADIQIDPESVNLSALFFQRHPAGDYADKPISKVMQAYNFGSAGKYKTGIYRLLYQLVEMKRQRAESQLPPSQNYLIEISPDANAYSTTTSDLLWLGVKGEKLYITVYPGNGLLLAYEVPVEKQASFITHFLGLLGTQVDETIRTEGKSISSVREVFFRGNAATYTHNFYNEPNAMGAALCCFTCLLCLSCTGNEDGCCANTVFRAMGWN